MPIKDNRFYKSKESLKVQEEMKSASPTKLLEPYYEIIGGTPLKGAVQISGSKNAALPIIASTLLTQHVVRLSNIPQITDIEKMLLCLNALGKKIDNLDSHTIQIESQNAIEVTIPNEARDIRGSILLLGSLLASHKKIILPLPGGCDIGSRPIDLHISALTAFGVDIVEEDNVLICTRQFDRLKATTVNFSKKTVTGTENVIMAAVLAEGTTLIQNAALEPEIDDLIRFLNLLGADIKGMGTESLEIVGVASLLGCMNYSIMSDRIEAGTYLVAAAITGGCITVNGISPQSIEAILKTLALAGAHIDYTDMTITLDMKNKTTKAIHLVTESHPGLPTDMQSLFLTLATMLTGASTIKETIFENRFQVVSELQKMGAEVTIETDTAHIKGSALLKGAYVQATDLRSGAALICAALAAEGISYLTKIKYIERGYEAIVLKLKELGAQINLFKPSIKELPHNFPFLHKTP